MARNKSERPQQAVRLVLRNLTHYYMHLEAAKVTLAPLSEHVTPGLSSFDALSEDPEIYRLMWESKLELVFKG